MSDCELSPSAHAFSTFLTAFIGSIVNGLCSGAFIAFVTGWIAWLAVIRVLIASFWEYWQTIQAGTDLTKYEPLTKNEPSNEQEFQQEFQPQPRSAIQLWMDRNLETDVKVTGWIGWIWPALYTPISQTIWVVANFSSDDGGVKLARAIAIGVSALGLTFDNKQRYGASIGRKWGSWAFVTFNVWNATACLLLGAECALLLVTGAWQLQLKWFLYIVYVFFSLVWAGVSFKLLPIMNGSRRGVNIFVDLLVGALAGVFVAAPALILWQNAKFDADVAQTMGESSSGGLSLGEYLSCEGASGLSKFAAIMP